MANLCLIHQALLIIWWEPWQCHLLTNSLSSMQSPWMQAWPFSHYWDTVPGVPPPFLH
jgi:hypothetical protein